MKDGEDYLKVVKIAQAGYLEKKGDSKTGGPGRNGLFCCFGCCVSIEILQRILHHKPLLFGPPSTHPPNADPRLEHGRNKQDTKRRDSVDGSIWTDARVTMTERSVKRVGGSGGEEERGAMTRCSCPDYQSMCSPYRLDVSPRMKASNVLFSTADQSRSRLSSDNLSVHSPSSSTAPAVVRAIRSPLMNRGPRSGQCRIGSNGCHLKADVSPPEASRQKSSAYQKLWKWYEKEPLKKPSNPNACGAALFWAGVLKKSPNLELRT